MGINVKKKDDKEKRPLESELRKYHNPECIMCINKEDCEILREVIIKESHCHLFNVRTLKYMVKLRGEIEIETKNLQVIEEIEIESKNIRELSDKLYLLILKGILEKFREVIE